MGIIHMNGRIYDPTLGRFLQADPFVEDATTLNRYTYVHNNPLSLTDPSGFFSFGKFFRTIASVAISVTAGIASFGAGFTLQGFLYATLGGALSGGIASGSINGALWGAFSGAVFFGIGAGFDRLAAANVEAVRSGDLAASKLVFGTRLKTGQFAAQSVSHGLAGGTIAEMQGGKFGHGFISSGVSKAATPGIAASKLNLYEQGFALAIVGGTTSRISGGKFANGAVTAAMAFAFNQVASSKGRFRRAVDNVVKKTKFFVGFVVEEGPGIIVRTATTVGGGGQVLLGGALCTTVLGCSLGAPVATLGASNIQEGLSGEPGFVRAASQDLFGETAGDLIVDGANLGSSIGGLARPVLREDTFKLFRNISSDFVPNYTTATRTGLVSEVASSSVSTADSINRVIRSDDDN